MNETQTTGIHIGQLIERVLDERGMTKAEFGRRIQTSRQNVNSLLRKSSMDTAYLMRVCQVLNHDFFADYANATFSGQVPRLPRSAIQPDKLIPYLRLKPEEMAREMMKLQEWQLNFFSKLTDDLEMVKRLKLEVQP